MHNTSSPENQLLARRWLQQCLSSHGDCIANIQSVPHIPARLVEISGSDANPILRIIETASRPREGEYITLSHCWGAAEFLTLRESCIDNMKEGIVWSSLPQTFQDAVIVTMWFQIKYLWIDSLCIIQDSQEDWEKESKNMKHIYKNSFLTIAATRAVDAAGGLFIDRNPDIVRISKVHALWSPELEGDYLFFVENLWYHEILESPLMKRAWVYQERLLSPRVLHLGRSQMLWECQSLDACETFPESVPSNIRTGTRNTSKRLLLFQGEELHTEKWTSVVMQYSVGNLTNISDKCIAFAAIVEEFQAFFESEHLAGFWRHNLEQQLLWCLYYMPQTVRPQPYIAPSWSWLSIDGAVSPYEKVYEEKVLLEILDVSVAYSSENPLGPIKHGYIKARGILGPAVWERRKEQSFWTFRSIRGCRPSSVSVVGNVFMDEREDRTSGNAVYLPVTENLRDDGGPWIIDGLLLVPTGEAKNEYRRIGFFTISGEEDRRLMLETKTARGVWRRLPRRTFTIV